MKSGKILNFDGIAVFGSGNNDHTKDGDYKACAPFFWECNNCRRIFIRPLRLEPKFCSRKCSLEFYRNGEDASGKAEAFDHGYAG
jgi:hypothetical protein